MNKKRWCVIIALLMLASGSAMAAGDAKLGKDKSAGCAGCHGATGVSSNPMYPNLAGQKAMYLVKAIKAYKTGARKDAMMGSMVSSLTDSDIENIAAYYASLK